MFNMAKAASSKKLSSKTPFSTAVSSFYIITCGNSIVFLSHLSSSSTVSEKAENEKQIKIPAIKSFFMTYSYSLEVSTGDNTVYHGFYC